ncbi:MAG TPA: 30S ribosomal protein S1 [Terriglobales bacterium]|nr:30S ribosomal protein S1 [Terriglobales bacterium]
MPNSEVPESQSASEATESFSGLLSQYERGKSHQPASGNQIEGTVIAVSADSVFLDIGFKTEGVLPLAEFQQAGEKVERGDKITVAIKGRDPEGYYQLSRFKIAHPTDWDSLERAFNEKSTIVGTVTGVVKGGLNVDIGVRAFMPASRSGVRDAVEMEKLVEQEVRCRIIKLDVADEDVVVDRRAVLEEEERSAKERRYSELKEGDVVRGQVRSLADYGAFVDLAGIDGLLHVGEISWSRINKPSDVLSVGQEIEAKVIKIESDRQRLALSMKQMQPHPWESVGEKYKVGDRVRGVVTRLMDFGAFVEIEPGVEGLIHVSEMSWAKRVRKASDLLKPRESVETVVLGINLAERRISLGLKQALGDPWTDVERKFIPGTVVQGPVTKIMNFGAFVELAEGIEGMIHVSEISAEKRINHPRDVFKVGQQVKAQVLAVDKEKHQLRLSIKQMSPSSLDEYIAERKQGDTVSGRVIDVSAGAARVELGEGVHGTCRISAATQEQTHSSPANLDLSALTSMLSARWKSGAPSGAALKSEPLSPGQIRSFRITVLNPETKSIELELV